VEEADGEEVGEEADGEEEADDEEAERHCFTCVPV